MTRAGFLQYDREPAERRPVAARVRDYREVYLPLPVAVARQQAARCMDCGVAFCHHGCPLANLIPEWNALVERDQWEAASHRLHETNNFPEFTGRLCPAPCEPACVLALNDSPVAIKHIEQAIADRAFDDGAVRAEPPAHRSDKRVAVIGSGPAGLAAAQQLNRGGHLVTVYEKADRVGGLLRYGIPDFKMEKWLVDRRVELLESEGVIFETGVHAGIDLTASQLEDRFDAVVLAVGAELPRDIDVPGRRLAGIHLAMDYLIQQNRRVAGDADAPAEQRISARGRDVVIIGGGDTGADCLGNVIREGCRSVQQLYIYPRPPERRPPDNPWPEWPLVLQTHAAHEEGGSREFALMITSFSGWRERVRRVHALPVRPGAGADGRRFHPTGEPEVTIDADLVLLAVGFEGAAPTPLLDDLGAARDELGRIVVDARLATTAARVFAAGDACRGASLVVWAIAEGRTAARSCDAELMGAIRLP